MDFIEKYFSEVKIKASEKLLKSIDTYLYNPTIIYIIEKSLNIKDIIY